MTISFVDLPSIVTLDFVSSFCGKLLGCGIGRQVYEFALDHEKVIKIETSAQSFQNTIEWETWRNLKDTPSAKWLAPCHWISSSGIVLVMQKTRPFCPGEEPEQMPAWLSDFKRENYGIIDGKPVCHDYGTNLLLNHGAFTKRMQKPSWY